MNNPAGPRQKILVIEDEPDIARGLRDALEFEGFEVALAGKGRDGIRAVREQTPALILLDLMLPDMNGFAVCEEIRKQNTVVPIIMLTARAQDTDKIRGLASGADDYVTKPFSVGELIARINAIFRRLRRIAPADEVLTIGGARISLLRQELELNNEVHALSFYEVELLRLLAERAGQPVTRDEILDKIWGMSGAGSNRSVDNTIVKLRKKLEADPANPRHIVTIYGTGYKLVV